ncbi:glycosyltransferase family 2 protein [Knoellia locipacati]|uniref:glycosyltransferase family 2 protein n=1 Tax=Knoellia locipacati TaxID=882824 RepID=UPI00384CE397
MIDTILEIVAWAVLGYFVLSNGFQSLLLGSAVVELRSHRRRTWGEDDTWLLGSAATPRVTILAPAYNEASTVGESVRALLTLSYPNLEIVLVNDGSTDDTLDVLRRQYDLVAIHPVVRQLVPSEPLRGLYRSRDHPGLTVVDKHNGGKADSLNAALNCATGELVCAIDADTLIDPEAFLRIVQPFLRRDDVVAVGATIRVVNGSTVSAGRVVTPRVPRQVLAGIQAVEYLRAFLFGRLGWNRLGGNLIISGAFGMFRRDAVVHAGGYLRDTVGEDMELVARLRRGGGTTRTGQARVTFVPDPIAWTEVPESLVTLGRQRDRWQRGLADVLWRHRSAIGNPRAGALGLLVYPYFVVVELLGPVIEGLGLLALALSLVTGSVNVPLAVLLFLACYLWGLLLSLWAIALHMITAKELIPLGDVVRLTAFAVVETFGYRQLTVYWRITGIVKYLRRRTEWGTMPRSGFRTDPE